MKTASSVIICLPPDISIICRSRLDERRKNPYDIIWEDDIILAGKVQKIEILRFLSLISLTNASVILVFCFVMPVLLPARIN